MVAPSILLLRSKGNFQRSKLQAITVDHVEVKCVTGKTYGETANNLTLYIESMCSVQLPRAMTHPQHLSFHEFASSSRPVALMIVRYTVQCTEQFSAFEILFHLFVHSLRAENLIRSVRVVTYRG